MKQRGKLFAIRRIERTQRNREGRLIVNRTDGTAANGTERAAGPVRRTPRIGLPSGSNPFNLFSREFDPHLR